ncbi:MAG: YqeG family HAD IIIA-type phosphatase [Oscillospiraceae bacterium]|nr:YqeG family HAD IIIA-type phosphatase [Oscillospiraceae bacterium]
MKLPVPDFSCHNVTQITPDIVRGSGISLLMLDLDNTIAPYKTTVPAEHVLRWVRDMKEAGIDLHFVSNSKRPDRVEGFAGILDIGYIKAARKPGTKALKKVMADFGRSPEECALVGDQIYTDVWAASRAGCRSFLVHPIRFTNPFLFLRYLAEAPFRALRRSRLK